MSGSRLCKTSVLTRHLTQAGHGYLGVSGVSSTGKVSQDIQMSVPVATSKSKRLLLQEERVKSVFVLQDINTTTGNALTKREWPYVRALRRFFATDSRVQRTTTANKTSNAFEQSFIRCPKFRILSDGASGPNTNQTCSALLNPAPSNTMIQPNPNSQSI